MLTSDAQGFLIGAPVGDGDASRMLSDIKGDTSRILAAIIRAGRMAATAKRGPGQAAAAAGLAHAEASMPATASPRRYNASTQPRGADGRFIKAQDAAPPVGMPRSSSVRAAEPVAAGRIAEAVKQSAAAAQKVASTVEKARRDDEAKERIRGADGRFGAGQRAGGEEAAGGGRVSRFLKGIFGRMAGGALDGGEQVDPALAAAAEVKTGIGKLAGVLRIGDAFERKADTEEAKAAKTGAAEEKKQTGLLRRILRNTAGGTALGGGLSLPSLTSLLPGAGTAATTATAAAAGGAAAAAVAMAKKAVFGMKALAKRIPILGPLIEGTDALLDANKLDERDDLTPDAKSEKRAGLVGRAGGAVAAGLAGAKLGAMAGAPLGPVGAFVGGAIGGVLGAWGGGRAGEAVGTAASRMTGPPRPAAVVRPPVVLPSGGVHDELAKAAKLAGADPAAVMQIAGLESRFNPNAAPIARDQAKNTQTQHDGRKAISTAHGLGQFLDSTWLETLRKHGGKYGIENASQLTEAQAKSLRGNVSLQAAMLAEHTADNARMAKGITGAADPASVYALHNLGQTGGKRFLGALQKNPNAPLSAVLRPEEIANNPVLYGDGRMTVQQAHQRMSTKLAGEARMPTAATAATAVTTASTSMPAMMAAAPMPRMTKADMPPAVKPETQVLAASRQPASAALAVQTAAQDVNDRLIAHIATGGIGRQNGIF
jgi:hypothetical protein